MKNIAQKIADLLRTAAGTDKHKFTSAVIVAAGSGTRFGGDGVTKQQTMLNGIPVVVRSLLAFEQCQMIDEIVVVARADEAACYDDFAARYGITKLCRTVCGGETRQISVLRGFDAISDRAEFVAIHDAARCLITPEMISNVVHAAYIDGAAAAATRVRDTIKRAENGYITETVDRADAWLVQTPQVFDSNIYRAAAYTAKEAEFSATDDCMLAERAGFRVRLVECGSQNMKLTVPDDLTLMSAIAAQRECTDDGSK